MQTINFIFFGRLEKEKGFDLILDLIKKFKNDQRIKFFIFGRGKYEEDLISGHGKNVEFFGWQDKRFISTYLSKSHYTLMPSMFLETFGLTALESLYMGIPVIGFAKGGLDQFIVDKLDISRQSGADILEKFENLIIKLVDSFDYNDWRNLSNELRSTAKQYMTDKWIQSFEHLNPGKDILMVSDYLPKIGGIENYIYDVKDILSDRGYRVEIFGWNGFSGKVSKIDKIFGLPFTAFNLFYYLKLKKKIKSFSPDSIWIHSVGRFLGWFPLMNLKRFKGKKYVMYHDLGFFHPFPSKVYFEDQIKYKFGFYSFLGAANTKNPFKILPVFLKYLSALSIHYFLKKYIDRHLVPSSFMIDIIDRYGIDNSKITLLPHFIKHDDKASG